VESNIVLKKATAYDAALRLLLDLRDVALGRADTRDFDRRVKGLRRVHEKKPSFIRRLNEAGV